MLRPQRIRQKLVTVLALVPIAIVGCGLSMRTVPLSTPASEAPKLWTPIMECAKEAGYRVTDMTKDSNGPWVSVDLASTDQLEVNYKVNDGQMEMILKIWGKVSDDDREKILQKMRQQGDAVWACARQKAAAPTATGTTAGAAADASGSASATPPP